MALQFNFYLVQQWERKKWRTKLKTFDLRFAFDKAHQCAIATTGRVRVVRVQTMELVKFN